MMNTATALTCTVCGTVYPADDRLTCEKCGPSDGILDVQYDYDLAAKNLTRENLATRSQRLGHWRYEELLPVGNPVPATDQSREYSERLRTYNPCAGTGWLRPTLQVGNSPVSIAPTLAGVYGVNTLVIKDDGRNPTSSFKDRASSVGVAKALEFGYPAIACASTGNAASSLAGMAANVGLPAYIFVPERAPEPKLTQLLVFGANVIRVRGTYDQAYDLCMEAADVYGWYQRNCAVNSYLVEGKKTCGLEIAEQMTSADRLIVNSNNGMPDWIVMSVGDGCSIAGVWKGIREMHRLGFFPKLPRMLGVQAEGSPAVAHQFAAEGEPPLPTDCCADTIADSICVGVPRNWRKAVRALRESHGEVVTVSDDEILEALRTVPRETGIFGEPAASAAFAGIVRARERQIIGPNESVLAVVTGNGLKDVRTAASAVGAPMDVEPNLAALEAALAVNRTAQARI